jgi:hypothetical protein
MPAAALIPVAVSGAIELAKLAMELIDTWKNNPEDQAALDVRWAQMQAQRDDAIAAWEASKQANNQ